MTGALVVWVGVGEGVSGDRMAVDPAQDATGGVARGGVDEHVLDDVDVDGVRRKAADLPDAVGELLHGAQPYPRDHAG